MKPHQPAPCEKETVLATAAAARAAGLSWRQIEVQLRSAGIKISYVTLRSKLTNLDSSNKEEKSQQITRTSLVRELLPLISARRISGLSMNDIAVELTNSGFSISADSLRAYISKAKNIRATPRENPGSAKHG